MRYPGGPLKGHPKKSFGICNAMHSADPDTEEGNQKMNSAAFLISSRMPVLLLHVKKAVQAAKAAADSEAEQALAAQEAAQIPDRPAKGRAASCRSKR